MSKIEKFEGLISLLIGATRGGEVQWSIDEAPRDLVQGTDDIFPIFLHTKYKNQKIGLYEMRYKHFYDEYEYHWYQGAGICLMNFNKVIYRYEVSSPALSSLLEVAKHQASDIDNLLDDLL